GRTDDPVRMYMREMGSLGLLSREGEIAIAKRIEAGREMMIGGLCESPLTVSAVILWRDALNDGTMLLRAVIDLDATYNDTMAEQAGPDDAIIPALAIDVDEDAGEPETEGGDGEDDEGSSVSAAMMEAALRPNVTALFDE